MTVNKLEPDNGTPNDELFTVAGMFDGSLYKLLLRMALPMFVGMLTQVTYAIADIFWLSHIDVTNSGIIAGVGLVFPVGMGLFAIANGIQIGMGSLLSRAIGMQRLDRAQRILSVGIIIALFFAIVITVLGYVYAQPLLRSLGATKSIIGYATEFYYYSLLTVFSIMLIGVMMGLFQGAGKIMVIMKASLLGALVNIMLDPIMIFVFDFWCERGGIGVVSGATEYGRLFHLHIDGITYRVEYTHRVTPILLENLPRVSLRRHGADADATDHCGRHSDL